jgi:arsenate reductase-like glutaredoxin family protein
MHQIYSYDNFGYRRNSLRFLRNREIARNAVPEVRSWLRENGRVLEFLIDRQGTSFRSTDLEEMAFMDRHQVNEVISLLSSYKMLTKEKSQLVMEPELQALISQMEKRRK